MTNKSCCFFGQSSINFRNREIVFESVYRRIETLIKDGYTDFTFGSWGDFAAAARIAVSLQKKFNLEIKTVYYLIYSENADELREKYDTLIPPAQMRPHNALARRGQAIISASDYCIFYVINQTGEARRAMEYAKSFDKPYVNLAEV